MSPNFQRRGAAAQGWWNKRPRGLGSYQPVSVNLISGCRFNDSGAGASWMKLSKAGKVLKGLFFLNKRSEGASFCLATHPPQQCTPFWLQYSQYSRMRNCSIVDLLQQTFQSLTENTGVQNKARRGKVEFRFLFCHQFEPFSVSRYLFLSLVMSCPQVSEQI